MLMFFGHEDWITYIPPIGFFFSKYLFSRHCLVGSGTAGAW